MRQREKLLTLIGMIVDYSAYVLHTHKCVCVCVCVCVYFGEWLSGEVHEVQNVNIL